MSEAEYENYLVVVNEEDQYSIWPSFRPLPLGWSQVADVEGSRDDCLAYIDRVWTDMRPKSLRLAMAAGEAESSTPRP